MMSIVVFEAASDYSGLVSLGGDGFEFEPYERKDHFLETIYKKSARDCTGSLVDRFPFGDAAAIARGVSHNQLFVGTLKSIKHSTCIISIAYMYTCM